MTNEYLIRKTDELKKYNADLETELDSAWKELDRLKAQLKEERNLRRNLEDFNKTLLAKLKSDENSFDILPEKCTYKNLAAWLKNNFANKVVLSPRAQRSLKSAAYEDVKLVYRALEMLGTEYWNMRKGLIPKSEFDKRCNELHLEEDATITDNRAGERDDNYFLLDDKGQRKRLDRHLKKGRGHDEKNCLRIYFYWDDDDEVVVIGNLPGHLETRQS